MKGDDLSKVSYGPTRRYRLRRLDGGRRRAQDAAMLNVRETGVWVSVVHSPSALTGRSVVPSSGSHTIET
jgi:hypothetical protein